MSKRCIDTEPATRRPRVLLLAPSGGLGGGIERYLDAVQEALRAGGAEVHRVDLRGPGNSLTLRSRLRFTAAALRVAVRSGPFDTVLAGLPNLIPVAALAVPLAKARRGLIVFHGTDIWAMRTVDRAILTLHPTLRPVTVSSFSSGALARVGMTPVLRPGIPNSWRAALLAAGSRRPTRDAVPTVLSVFRLNDADWVGKGLRELLAALSIVRGQVGPVRLVVAGQGPVLDAVRQAVAGQEAVQLVESPDDSTLAELFAAADLFVLCTRTRVSPPRSGEGYGLVLTEAQLAGCPVVGPAYGARDAYVDGVTGATPADESPQALAAVLTDLLSDQARLASMRQRCAEWAQLTTEPEQHVRNVFRAVLGTQPATSPATGTPAPPVPAQATPASPQSVHPADSIAAKQ
ncbi:glycosyl transferase group 1 [Pseudofrankia inefficax]|uniref:Glycosyl transferase group 1 n=1 Tax=Pseudofrankia inefficax (strain DSM 45817 / CECT 9037 / DDB 130130 / EuI1c) TaxID=298654 RepID=E3IYZ6_PSEI1|nr:glycosyl transferase group 1 [Pseudofrankia inefficax]